MEKNVILQGLSIEGLLTEIDKLILSRLNELKEELKPQKPIKYLSRKEVGAIFRVSLATLHIWTKIGIVKSYKIGSRVLYKSDEIEFAIEGKELKNGIRKHGK